MVQAGCTSVTDDRHAMEKWVAISKIACASSVQYEYFYSAIQHIAPQQQLDSK